MIVHFLEVWVLLAVAFSIGCFIGALAYELLAQSPMERAQLAVAGAVGNAVDRFRERLGIDPTWREYRYVPESVATPEQEEYFDVSADAPERRVDLPRAERQQEPPALVPEDAAEAPRPAAPEPVETQLPDGLLPMRPASLIEPRRGVPDNLQKIRGVGKKNERALNSLGIFHFGQIAAWTPAEILWIGQRIAFPERIEGDDWIGQAVILASGGGADISKPAEQSPRDALFLGDAEGTEDDDDGSPNDDGDFEDADDGEPPVDEDDFDDFDDGELPQ